MSFVVLVPVLLPLVVGATSLLAWHRRGLQRVLAVGGTAGLLAAGLVLLFTIRREGILVVELGDWPAPFGITFVADLFGAIMVCLAGLMGLAVAIYSLAAIDPAREFFGYYPLVHILLMGVCGAFLTGDIFNLYVWFEVLLMASFVLMALGGERGQLEGAIKYVTLNLLSSAFFLAAVGICYGTLGSLSMADLSRALRETPEHGLETTLGILFLVAFGIKAAAFPLFFWLPASYHLPPAPVSALFAGLLTKVGVYAIIRVFTLLFVSDVGYTHRLILVVAGLTMITGVLGAVAQDEFRRILSFHIISQIGYMLMGLGLFTPLGVAGSVFYIIHHIIVKTTLFLVSGVAHRLGGSYQLKRLGGLYASQPGISVLFLVPALALAGMPPLSGFFAKLTLIKAGLDTADYAIVAVALVVSLLTLFSMTKIWAEAFWKPAPVPAAEALLPTTTPWAMLLPIAGLATLSVAIGLLAGPLTDLSLETAGQLLDPSVYVTAVLGSASEP